MQSTVTVGPMEAAVTLTRGQKLTACVKGILESEGVPPFSETAMELISSTLDAEMSSARLSRVILKDVGLTSQLLRVANSAMYNRSHRPILSVAHAVMLLGWERIRNLVGAVRYVEHFAARSAGVRELMLMSVLTALHCRDVANAVGYPQPEDAYLAGLFRNLGEVLVACHHPRQYAAVILKMHAENATERVACLAALGFTWDEVADRVAEAWKMPASMHGLNEAVKRRGTRLERCLASVSDFAHDLTHAEYRRGTGIGAVNLKMLLDPRGRGAVVPERHLRRIVESSLEEAQRLFAGLRIPADRLRLERQSQMAEQILRRSNLEG